MKRKMNNIVALSSSSSLEKTSLTRTEASEVLVSRKSVELDETLVWSNEEEESCFPDDETY